MNVVLTHGYFIHEDQKEAEIMKPYPPLGILYVAAYLEANNISNSVFDSTFKSFKEQTTFLLKQLPEFICIYTNLITKLNVIKLMKWIRETSKLNDSKIILGGPDVTYNWENYLKSGADYLVIGEGEQTTHELITSCVKGEDLSQITGIAYKNKNGDFVKNAPRIKIKNIDELSFPAREKIDIDAYLSVWKKYHGASAINVSTQRGCPFTCKWCSTAVYGQSYRRRSPALVADEIEYLKRTYNPDGIWFVDDVFTVNFKWIKELNKEFQKRGLKIPFECITRAERLNDAILKCLQEMGCFRIWIGAESGSQKIIDAMDRKVAIEQVRSMIKRSRDYGIQSGTFIMVGYPGEDEKDINETIYHLKVSNPDIFTITLAYPIKGTSFHNEIESKITTKFDWETTTDRNIDFKRFYPTKYYEYAIRRIVNEVNYFKNKEENGMWTSDTVKYKLKSIVAKGGMIYAKRF